HVSKSFQTSSGLVQALEDVSLAVGEGEFVCLVGASGCGKSTLLNIIAGLEKPDTGVVLADGKPISGPGRERLVMFQESALFPWLNVIGNVLFGLKLKPNLTDKDRCDVVKYCHEVVGLTRFESANIHELSGGMKQRVALARHQQRRSREHRDEDHTLAQTSRSGEGSDRGMKRALSIAAFFAALILLWYLIYRARIWSPVLLPSPLQVAAYLKHSAEDGTL